MVRARLSLISILYLGLVLASCGESVTQCLTPVINATNLPLLATTEAIKLAKQTAAKLLSPPSTYNTCYSNKDNSCPETYEQWPNDPGVKVHNCFVGNEYPCTPSVVTYTTAVLPESQGLGQYVTFSSEWVRTAMPIGHHSWQFYVGNDSKVQFLCEQGDSLPHRPS